MERAGLIAERGILFDGRDMIQVNLQMEVRIRGKEQMYPLISAGMNWYEAHHVCEFILDGERELRITSQPMAEGDPIVHTDAACRSATPPGTGDQSADDDSFCLRLAPSPYRGGGSRLWRILPLDRHGLEAGNHVLKGWMIYELLSVPASAGRKPYYIENIRMNIYSLEELCFYLYNNACLIDESLLNERLARLAALG